jgi:hypothetical protein
MKGLMGNVIASIIALILSTIVGLILQTLGLSTQISITLALIALVVLFIIIGKFYPMFVRWLTLNLVQQALSVSSNEPDKTRMDFKKNIIEQMAHESSEVSQKQDGWIIEFANQASCEERIVNAFRDARNIKILTIRGEKYFLGHRSLFHNLCLLKQGSGFTIKVLVLSPDARHITEELAEKLGQSSVKEVKLKMQLVFDYLKVMSQANKNFEIKYYDETPIFKILLFDNVMFVSAFIQAKSDYNVKMLQITREGNALFESFEKYFDNLWKEAKE